MRQHSVPDQTDSGPPEKLWNINFVTILVLGFLTGTANQMVAPQLAKYVISLGGTITVASTVVGILSAISLFMRPFSGAASDLINRKYVFIFSIFMTTLAYGGYLLFDSIAAVFVCRTLHAIGFSFQSVARIAFASEFIPKERMGEGISLATFGIVLSQAMGPNIGLWVSDTWGFNACFAVAMFACILGIILIGVRPYKSRLNSTGFKMLKFRNLLSIEAIPYALLSGLIFMAIQLGNSFIVLLGDERNIPNILLFFTVYSILTLLARPLSGKILDKRGLAILLYPSFVFAVLSLALIGAAQSLMVILVAGICRALSQGVALPAIQGYTVKYLGMEHAGVLAATISMGQDLLGGLAPIIGGVLIDNFGFGYGDVFYAFAGLTLLGIPGYMLLQRHEKRLAGPKDKNV